MFWGLIVALTAEEIGVNADALQEEDRVKFRLFVQTAGRSQATAEYIVSVNAPPYGGTCRVSPDKGIEFLQLKDR